MRRVMRRVEVTDWRNAENKSEGLFHQFGLAVDESCDGNVSYSVAIVERPDGSVQLVGPDYIRFLDSPEVAA